MKIAVKTSSYIKLWNCVLLVTDYVHAVVVVQLNVNTLPTTDFDTNLMGLTAVLWLQQLTCSCVYILTFKSTLVG